MLVNFYVLSSYFPIIIFICFACVISTIMLSIPFLLNNRTIEKAKLDPYECGSDPIGGSHAIFDARFYLVGMLFILFDLEVLFLFPWALSLGSTGLAGFCIGMIFLFILTIGFIYEFKKGALEWE